MRVEYHPDTVADLNDSIDYYDRQRVGLGSELRDEIYKAVDRIVANPLINHRIEGEIRRSFVHRFPFSVLYRLVDDETIRILVIRHHRRHPGFGLHRE